MRKRKVKIKTYDDVKKLLIGASIIDAKTSYDAFKIVFRKDGHTYVLELYAESGDFGYEQLLHEVDGNGYDI